MPFTIAQVTPWPWEQHHEVNRFVESLSNELCARGHRVAVVAPSDSRELVHDGRAKVAAAESDPDAVFAEPGCASVLAVGQSLPFRRGGSVSLPLDVSRSLEELLERVDFDFVHVHEPFAPSASSAALRHSRALNVGTFHSTTERFVSTQVARKVVELLFGRLDGRTTSSAATRDLIERYFPGDYEVILPGADLLPRPEAGGDAPEIVFSAEEERGALRLFVRALRRLSVEHRLVGHDLAARSGLGARRDAAAAPARPRPHRRAGGRLGGSAPGPRHRGRGRFVGHRARASARAARAGRRGRARGVAAPSVRGARGRRRSRPPVRAARRADARGAARAPRLRSRARR